MTYLAQYKAFTSEETRGRVAFAALKIARDVRNEAAAAANYQARRNLAEAVIADPVGMGEEVLRQVFLDPAVAGAATEAGALSSTDEQLETAVSAAWDGLAARMRF